MCFDKRKTPVRILMGCSIFAVIFGILMIVFAFMLTNNSILDQMEQENSDISDARKFVFMVLLIFSLVTIGIASCGFCLKCIKNRCFTCMYGIVLLPTWIFLIVVGAVAIMASVASSDAITDQCVTINQNSVTLNEDSNIVISIDIFESLGVNSYMCSTYCPCAETNAEASWGTENFVTSSTSDIKSYQDCIEYYAQTENQDYNRATPVVTETDLAYFYAFAEEFRGQSTYDDIVKWIAFFEDEYDCAGICTPARFYFTRSIDSGKPSSGCVESIKDEVTNAFTGLGITTLIAGIFLFFIFIMQYCLWRKY